MAIVVEAFQATSAADLVTAINTYLATLTNPKINGVSIDVEEDGRSLGRTYRALITTQTGGAVIATPWVLSIFEGLTAEEVEEDVITLVAGGGSTFYSAPRIQSWYYNTGSHLQKCMAWIMANSTAGGSANWLPL